MENEVFYMLGVVLTVFAVTYLLRALPFILFAGRDRDLPPCVERASAFVSPVIIAGLIVYSYSGLAWRTPWPYLAGVLTVGLHLWRRNPLVSIVAGTALYMALVCCCGCATSRTLELDAQHPAVRVSTSGIYLGDALVRPDKVAGCLEDFDVPRERTIHILLDDDVRDLRPARFLMACLAKAGYTRPVLVTRRHAEAVAVGRKKPVLGGAAASPSGQERRQRKIRYKKGDK